MGVGEGEAVSSPYHPKTRPPTTDQLIYRLAATMAKTVVWGSSFKVTPSGINSVAKFLAQGLEIERDFLVNCQLSRVISPLFF